LLNYFENYKLRRIQPKRKTGYKGGEGLKKSIKRYSAIIEYWQNIFKELNTLPVLPNYAEKYYV
jgi:hypothetical protein